jgi:hypothetical protein
MKRSLLYATYLIMYHGSLIDRMESKLKQFVIAGKDTNNLCQETVQIKINTTCMCAPAAPLVKTWNYKHTNMLLAIATVMHNTSMLSTNSSAYKTSHVRQPTCKYGKTINLIKQPVQRKCLDFIYIICSKGQAIIKTNIPPDRSKELIGLALRN